MSGAGLSALALPGLARARTAFAWASRTAGVSAFVSAPSLTPPTVTVSTLKSPLPGYLFVSSLNGPGQRGPAILDDHGRVVWFHPVKTVAINFSPQAYAGKPVLTWWEGTISSTGIGQGEGVIVDQSYKTVARVQAGNGFKADVHEFLLTPSGTALITIFNPVQADLSAVGGPVNGTVLDSILQEVDVRSGKVLLEWHSLDHVPITDSYAPVLDPFDYFHLNSIDVDSLDGNLIVSARNTSAVYKLDRKSGQVLWQLNGRSGNFQMGLDAPFMYQHDARIHPDGTLTLFDDGPSASSQDSRGLRLGLDFGAMRADVLQQYHHPAPLAATAMGNAQLLPGDAMLVCWGTQPYVTEFGPAGDVRFDAKFDGDAWNYRAFRGVWVGRPATKPDAVALKRNGNVTVYASWNGSTETAYWQVAAGETRSSLQTLKTVAAVPFETAVPVAGAPLFVSVTALDASRKPLAVSPVVAVRG